MQGRAGNGRAAQGRAGKGATGEDRAGQALNVKIIALPLTKKPKACPASGAFDDSLSGVTHLTGLGGRLGAGTLGEEARASTYTRRWCSLGTFGPDTCCNWLIYT